MVHLLLGEEKESRLGQHTIDLKIRITLNWYENRVVYYNLKTEEALNVLTDLEVN